MCLSPPLYSSKSASRRSNSTGFRSPPDSDRTVSGGSSVSLVYLLVCLVYQRSESIMSAVETLDRVELCESLLTWVSNVIYISITGLSAVYIFLTNSKLHQQTAVYICVSLCSSNCFQYHGKCQSTTVLPSDVITVIQRFFIIIITIMMISHIYTVSLRLVLA